MATLTNLRAEARNLLDDAAADRFSDADLAVYLSEGQVEFSRRTMLFIASYTLTTAAGTSTYSLLDGRGNAPVGPVLRVENNTGKEVFHTSEEVLDNLQIEDNWKNMTAPAARAWLRGKVGYSTVMLYPTPSLAGVTYRIYAPGYPPAMADNGVTDSSIPEHYAYALPFYAAYKCLLRFNDSLSTSMASLYKSRFDDIVNDAMQETGRSLRL
jgi:hypothetical protein